MASPVVERKPAPAPAPAPARPQAGPAAAAPTPQAGPPGGGLAAAVRRQADAAGPRVSLGPAGPSAEEVSLKGNGTFAPPQPVADFLATHPRGGGEVSVRLPGVAAGVIRVHERRGKYSTPSQVQAIDVIHPALEPLRSVGLTPLLVVEISTSTVTGYMTVSTGKRPLESRHALIEQLQRHAADMGFVGMGKLRMQKPVNQLQGGALTLSTDLAFQLGGFLNGTGSFGLTNDVVTFAAQARASVKGIAEVSLDLQRGADGVIAGRVEIPVNLKNFSGSLVVTLAGGVVDAVGTVHYATEKLSGEVTLLVTDAQTAKTVAYEHRPPEAIDASAREAAGATGGAAAAKTPKPGPRALAGWGTLQARFSDWLTGSAVVIVDGEGHVTVIGKITPQARVEFAQTRVASRVRLLTLEARATYGVPVVGDVFVFFSLSLDSVINVTPLTLSKIEVDGTYSTDPKIFNSFSLSANLNISAMAALELDARAGAGLEIADHDIKIGAGVTASAGVKSYLDATPILGYRELADPTAGRRGEFYIHGEMELAAQAFLALVGYLFVALETPWWSPISDHTWKWPIGELEYILPGQFGFGADIDYVFGSSKLPAISLKGVDFNPDRFAGDLMDDKVPKGKPSAEDKHGAWKEKLTAPPAPAPAPPKVLDSKGKPPPKDSKAVKTEGKAFADGVSAIEALRKRADAKPMPSTDVLAELDAIRKRHGLTDVHTKPGAGILEVTASRGKLKLPKPVRIKVARDAVKLPPHHAATPKPGSESKPGQVAVREEPFSVEGPSGTQQHHVIMRPAADGRAQILVASDETPLSLVIAHYAPLVSRLPQSGAAPPSPRPKGWREDDQPRMQAEASITRLRRVPDRPARVTDPFVPGMKDDLARLLHMFAVYDRPPQERLAGTRLTGQHMSARVMLRPGAPGSAASAGVLPGTRTSPAGRPYARMLPDPDLVESVPTSRGAVYLDVPNEVVARTWASGGTRREATNTSHTENQFERWLSAQGVAFLGRISAIELRSNLSPCSACTDVLTGMVQQIRSAQAQGAPRVLAAFFWEEPYEAPWDNPLSIQSTAAHHVAALRRAGWLLYGPMPK